MKPVWRNLFGILFGILLVLTILLAAVLFTTWGHEDSLLWNCYPSAPELVEGSGQALMGNLQCRNVDHILGFILRRN